MKPEGSKSHLSSRLITFKFVCPKIQRVYDKSTQKSHRKYFLRIPARILNMGAWSTFIQKKIFGLTLVRFMGLRNRQILTKYAPLLKLISTI